MRWLLTLTLALTVWAAAADSHPIKNVIVLMMENHSFGNMLGFHPVVGDLSPAMFNLVDPANASSERIHITKGAPWCVKPDPIHIVPDVGAQITAPNPAFGPTYTPTMGGFVANFLGRAGATRAQAAAFMSGYTPEQVPVISELASSFRVFTRWFSAVAGSTGINRLFAHAATSGSYTGGEYELPGLRLDNRRTVFDALLDAGFTAAIEYVDFTSAHGITPLAHAHADIFSRSDRLEHLFDAIKHGTLANYTFAVPQLFPRLFAYPTSQHPSGDVRAGETLIKDLYDALVASQYWNDTLLVITYDEHGGFFDPVPPPGPGAGSGPVPDPEPDVLPHPYTYDFTRLGVRIPTIAISPWLDPEVVSDEFWGSSIPATLFNIFGLAPHTPPLTSRMAAAPTFDSGFRTTIRPPSSYPTTLPAPPADPPLCPIFADAPPFAPEFLAMYQSLLDDAGIALDTCASDLPDAFAAAEWIIAAGDALLAPHRR